jgi:sterol desaturase/sphingolipid hydroxylase (fatty acid hydroxylase superfamily)
MIVVFSSCNDKTCTFLRHTLHSRCFRLDKLNERVCLLLGNTTYAVTWMYFIEPYLWTTNYFVHRDYTLGWFVLNVVVYAFVFDSWFYWTHRALHESLFLWDKIHTTHHAFKTPSAFCQDAVHPLEGLVQGMTDT